MYSCFSSSTEVHEERELFGNVMIIGMNFKKKFKSPRLKLKTSYIVKKTGVVARKGSHSTVMFYG